MRHTLQLVACRCHLTRMSFIAKKKKHILLILTPMLIIYEFVTAVVLQLSLRSPRVKPKPIITYCRTLYSCYCTLPLNGFMKRSKGFLNTWENNFFKHWDILLVHKMCINEKWNFEESLQEVLRKWSIVFLSYLLDCGSDNSHNDLRMFMPLKVIKEHRLLDRQDSFLKTEPLKA